MLVLNSYEWGRMELTNAQGPGPPVILSLCILLSQLRLLLTFVDSSYFFTPSSPFWDPRFRLLQVLYFKSKTARTSIPKKGFSLGEGSITLNKKICASDVCLCVIAFVKPALHSVLPTALWTNIRYVASLSLILVHYHILCPATVHKLYFIPHACTWALSFISTVVIYRHTLYPQQLKGFVLVAHSTVLHTSVRKCMVLW